jgi:hypothetical protein
MVAVKKFDKITLYIAGIIPWGLVVSFLLFYLHTSFLLGRFPSYPNPDPKNLNIYNFYSYIINALFLIWAMTFLIWIIALIIFIAHNKLSEYKKPLIIVIAGWIISFLMFFTPIFDWYMD